jgi:16S rRNA processing protein RimM
LGGRGDTPELDWIGIGAVAAPHGVHGEVRVKVDTDFPERFHDGAVLTLRQHGKISTRRVVGVRPHKTMMLIFFEGVQSREDADKLRGAEIVIRRDEVRKLPEGSWYIFELEGLEVYDVHGERLGILKQVLQSAANDVYVVQGAREVLIPAVKHVIKEVDLQARRMTVDLPEGL